MNIRRTYWTSSKFADWIRGTSKPTMTTPKAWKEWKQLVSTQHPYRYWLANTGLRRLQNFIMWPIDTLTRVRSWYLNSFVTKTHSLTSHTLERGRWYDFDSRMLYCCFDELVNYVELELGASSGSEYNPTRLFAKWRAPLRNQAAGIKHLVWETTLLRNGQPTDQAIQATTILELYNWWTITRPARSVNNEKYTIHIYQAHALEDTVMLTKLCNVRVKMWT